MRWFRDPQNDQNIIGKAKKRCVNSLLELIGHVCETVFLTQTVVQTWLESNSVFLTQTVVNLQLLLTKSTSVN